MTQSFLRNFGRNINRRQIRIAQNNEKISEIQFETQLITLISQAEESYWDLVFNRDNISVKRRALELAMKTQHDNETQVTVGSLAPIELVQSEAEVATRREDLITAQHTSQQLEDQVKKIISNSTDPGLVLARLDPTQAVADPSDQDLLPIEEGIRVALENRPEMRQTGYEIANRDVDVQFTKNQMLPSLDVTAKYTQSGLGGTRTISSGLGSAVVQVVPGGVGDVFTQLFGLDFPGYTLGFNVQIPISNRAAKADYSRAITEQKTANLRKDALAQQIALEVRNAYTQVDLNRARIETARVAHQLAIRRLDAEQKKFELGTSTVRFVLEEQRNLAQAETDEIEAKVNYAKSLVEYHRSIGNTLAKNNIEIDRELKQSPSASSK
jgi:outer membrane protein TolC